MPPAALPVDSVAMPVPPQPAVALASSSTACASSLALVLYEIRKTKREWAPMIATDLAPVEEPHSCARAARSEHTHIDLVYIYIYVLRVQSMALWCMKHGSFYIIFDLSQWHPRRHAGPRPV